MIQSMTGFGRGEATDNDYRITVEMKSVNHRYCDVNIRLPRKLNFYETAMRNSIKGFVSRGKVDVYVSFEDRAQRSSGITYNKETAAAYLSGIRQLSKDFSLECTINADALSRYPDVFTMEDVELDEESVTVLVDRALAEAGEKFSESRRAEGMHLQEDIFGKLDTIERVVGEIAARSPKIVEEYRGKIRSKVAELLGDAQIDENVLATEIIVFADKVCVDEEMVRLRTHIAHMRDTLKEADNIGRKLDFLIQEMNREANTILSKSNDVEVSDYGIQLKTEIEKIREQIQNIE